MFHVGDKVYFSPGRSVGKAREAVVKSVKLLPRTNSFEYVVEHMHQEYLTEWLPNGNSMYKPIGKEKLVLTATTEYELYPADA